MHNPEKIFILPFIAKYFGFIVIVIAFLILVISEVQISSFFKLAADDIHAFAIHAMLILGFVLITFSKEKIEDEYVNAIRLKSFLISTAFHALYFFVFSFTNFTLPLISFSAIILMNSLLMLYVISFYFLKNRD